MNYCPKCGQKLTKKTIDLEGDIPYCANCDELYFPHNSACAIVVIKYQGKILLIRQNYITKDHHVLVGGHIKAKETAEETIIKEVKEEVNLKVTKLNYVNSYYYAKDEHLMLGFICEAEGTVKTNHEVDSYVLVDKDEALELLKDSSIAIKVLEDAIKKDLI